MARAIWSGVLSFGLVSIPVRLYAATKTRRPAFHQFQKGTADRIRNLRVNEHTGAGMHGLTGEGELVTAGRAGGADE